MDIEAESNSEANFQNLLLRLKVDSMLMTLMGISKAFLLLIFFDKKNSYSFIGQFQNFLNHFLLLLGDSNLADLLSVELHVLVIRHTVIEVVVLTALGTLGFLKDGGLGRKGGL